jgi:hypothetical protein
MTRLLQRWLGRVLWFMIAIAAGWIVYRLVVTYGTCRLAASDAESCLFEALGKTWLDVLGMAVRGFLALLQLILP